MTSPIDPTMLALGQPGLEDDGISARCIVIGLMLASPFWFAVGWLAARWWLA
jgi:hypothetical protein